MARILLVEDFDLLQALLSETLRQAGHTVDCAKTKPEGEVALRTSRYDLLISDVLLPGGSGHELAALAEDLAIETVLMTGHPNEVRALRISGVRHLIKPFRLDDFMKMIDEVFAAT
jgi:DNA-binding response OmpR family regulator